MKIPSMTIPVEVEKKLVEIDSFKIIPPIKQKFMAAFKRYEPLARDSTAIATAKKCFRAYFFAMVLAFRLPKNGPPPYFAFGTGYHTFRCILEETYKKTGEQGISLARGWEAAKDGWPGDPKIAGNSYLDKWSHLTLAYLQVSCAVGFNHWKAEKEKGVIKVTASEQPFEVTLKDGKTSGGTADELIRWSGEPWDRDFKTTGMSPEWYERSQLDPKDQFYRYAHGVSGLVGEPLKGLLIETLFHHKVTKTHDGKPFIRSFIVSFTPSQLQRWEDEQVVFERMLDICREEDVWPACETFCGNCEYHAICKVGTERGMMAKLEQIFTQKHWDFKNIDNSPPGEI